MTADPYALAPQEIHRQLHRLIAIEAIHRLKYRYWRGVHTSRADEVGRCFSRDALFDYGAAAPLRGRDAIAAFFAQVVSDKVRVVLHGHNPEIEVTGPTTAKGLWQLDNLRIAENGDATRMGNGYVEDYVFEDGEWKIASSTVQYLYLEHLHVDKPTGPDSASAK